MKHELARERIGSDPLLSCSSATTSQRPVLLGASMPLPQRKRWHFFLSHQQQGADGYAALVYEKLKALGYSCWIDTEQPATGTGWRTV